MHEAIITEFSEEIVNRHGVSVFTTPRKIVLVEYPFIYVFLNLDSTSLELRSDFAFSPNHRRIHRKTSFELVDPECFEKLQVLLGKILEQAPKLKEIFAWSNLNYGGKGLLNPCIAPSFAI